MWLCICALDVYCKYIFGLLVHVCCSAATIITSKLHETLDWQRGWDMATIGKVGEFIPECESSMAFIKWMEIYFEANKIEEGRKVPMFLIISKTYSDLWDLLVPVKCKDKKFTQH